jgi:hypothetical protein
MVRRKIVSADDMGECMVTKSVLDAIREGNWNFEPVEVDRRSFSATHAIPGTNEKLRVLAERVRAGLPLWHDHDRADYEDPIEMNAHI